MMYKKEINKVYKLNKKTIIKGFNNIKDINSKQEVARAMLEILTKIDKDKDKENKSAIEDFFKYIDNIKNKTYLLSYKEEAEYSLISYIEQARNYLLNCIENASND